MHSLERILLVTNGAETEQRALMQASALAEATGAALLTVMDISRGGHEELAPADGYAVARGSELPVEGRTRVKLESNRSFEEVIAAAASHDLVIKPAGPRSAAQDRRLVRSCRCPVWIVRASSTDRPKKILAAVELGTTLADSGLARAVLAHATGLAGHQGAELQAVDIWEFDHELELRGRMNITGLVAEAKSARERQLDALIEETVGGVPVASRSINGDASSVLPELVRDEGVDLLVIANTAPSSLHRFFFGAAVERLLGRLDCSVLVVSATPQRATKRSRATAETQRRPAVASSAHAA